MKMIKKTLVLAALLAVSAGGWAEDKAYLFDMGPSNSPVWAGFTLVTAKTVYTKEQGYGVSSKGEMFDAINLQPDDLCRDFVEAKGKEPLEFLADVPNGEYLVCVISSDDFFWKEFAPANHLWQECRIMAEGTEVFRKQRDFFALQDRDYVTGECLWDKYIRDRYLICRFPVKVADGQMNLTFEGLKKPANYAFPLNCVMIYPVAMKDKMEQDLIEINNKRREAFLARWKRVPPDQDVLSFNPDDVARRRGYVLWPRNILRFVYPETTPGPEEMKPGLETFATPGEWESVSFCVRPLKALTNVTVAVSDLKCGKAVIPSREVRVQVVKQTEFGNGRAITYTVIPYTLMDWKTINIAADLTKQYWLKIHVPEEALAGVYEGTVTLTPENAPVASLPLRLRVLPFKLTRSPAASFFYFGDRKRLGQNMNVADTNVYWGFYKKEIEHLREYGFSPCPSMAPSIAMKIDEQNRTLKTINFEQADKIMDFLKENNALPKDQFLLCDVTWSVATRFKIGVWIQDTFPVMKRHIEFSEKKEDLDLFMDIVKRIDAHIREKGYGIPVFECGGELSNYRNNNEGIQWGLTAYGALKKAGVLTALRGNGPMDMEVIKAGLVDYAIPNIALIRDEWTDIMKQKCKGLWLYNFSSSRYGFGFFAWKKGATRRLHEGYVNTWGMPWDNFNAGPYNWYVGGDATRDGIATRIYLELMAEGRDDYDYLLTCDELMKKAEASKEPAVKTALEGARQTMAFIAENTFTDYDYAGDRAQPGDVGCRWSLDDFQKYRWLVAMEIIKLQKVLADSK